MQKKRYILIYKYLLARIHYGFYPDGELLPSIYNLSDMFGVSTMTVRKAYCLLEKDGYIKEQNRRAVIIFDKEKKPDLPTDFFVQEEVLQDLYKSMRLILPKMFYLGLLHCNDQEIADLNNILKQPSNAWDEPTIHFLAYIIKQLNNPLGLDLYYDCILFSYPSYIVSLAQVRDSWKAVYGELHTQFARMLVLTKEKKHDSLWSLLKDTYVRYAPLPITSSHKFAIDRYSWGNKQVCNDIAGVLVYRVFQGIYPPNTFLPSAQELSHEFSSSLITTRRAIALLCKLGAAESYNGIGTKISSMQKGFQKIQWQDASVQKNIMIYLQAMHILAMTCRALVSVAFSHLTPTTLQNLKTNILLANELEHYDVAGIFCVKALTKYMPLDTARDIFEHLIDFLTWGQPLYYINPAPPIQDLVFDLLKSLDECNQETFTNDLEKIFYLLFQSSKKKILSVGIQEAGLLDLPKLE